MPDPSETRRAARKRLDDEQHQQGSHRKPPKEPRRLPLSDIHIEPVAFQPRGDGLNSDRAEVISRGLGQGRLDDPVHVWWSGMRWIVIDGHHRVEAYRMKQEREGGKALMVSVRCHWGCNAAEALALSGNLNGRPKETITKTERLETAWVLVCDGQGSITQQADQTGGTRIYAIGDNEAAAAVSGLPVKLTKVAIYALSGLLCAVAAMYMTGRFGVGDPRAGVGFDLRSITPVIVGGTLLAGGKGGVLGTALAVILLALLSNVLNFMNVSSFYQWIAEGLVIIAAVSFFAGKAKS